MGRTKTTAAVNWAILSMLSPFALGRRNSSGAKPSRAEARPVTAVRYPTVRWRTQDVGGHRAVTGRRPSQIETIAQI